MAACFHRSSTDSPLGNLPTCLALRRRCVAPHFRMTDAAALAVMNLTSKSVHCHDSSKEPVMIYYSLSCTRAATNALDVSQSFYFIYFGGNQEGINSLTEDFAKKGILLRFHLSFFYVCFFYILPSCFFCDKPKRLQLSLILVVISHIAKRLQRKIGHYYCLELC